MSLILALAGLGALIVPLLYALTLLGVWALIRNERLRRFGIAALVVVGLLQVVVGASAWAQGWHHQRRFEAGCASLVHARPSMAPAHGDEVLFDFDPYSASTNPASLDGNLAFSEDDASRLLLRGVDPYAAVFYRSGTIYAAMRVDPDGTDRTRVSDTSPAAGVRLRWEGDATQSQGGVQSLYLVASDLHTGKQIARQKVLVLDQSPLKAFPSLWVVPTIVRPERTQSCPSGLDIARFIRTTAIPFEGRGPAS